MITSPPRGPSWYCADVTRSTVPLLAGAERLPGKRRQVHVTGERKKENVRMGRGREQEGERERSREKETTRRGGRSSSFLFLRLGAIDLSFSPPLLDLSVASPSRELFRRTYVCPSVRLSFLDYLLLLADVPRLLHYRRSQRVSSSSLRRCLTSLLRSSLHRGCVGPSRSLPTSHGADLSARKTRPELYAEILNDFLPPRHASTPPRSK